MVWVTLFNRHKEEILVRQVGKEQRNLTIFQPFGALTK